MTKHKYSEAIIAWANGEKLQYRGSNDSAWIDVNPKEFYFTHSIEIRIKPHSEYPQTNFTGAELEGIYMDYPSGQSGHDDFVLLANTVIRRAIDDGQVYIANQLGEDK